MAGSLAQRVIEPELLDSLPIDDPRAKASRRDLVRINAVMFQGIIMARLLRRHVKRAPCRLLEIGAGDGRFMLSVARRLGWTDVDLTMLDQSDLVTPEVRADFAALGWRVHTAVDDVFNWIEGPELGAFDAICANLFLHHFDEAALAQLLAVMPQLTPCFLATEPRRSGLALWSTGWLRAILANGVTLHDAAASVRAGFAGNELSQLWPRASALALEERRVGPFTHAFVAATASP
jgi:hypothetical protein